LNVDELLADDAFDRPRRRALDLWRTGDLVPGARLFWAGPDGEDHVFGLSATGASDRWQVRSLPGGEDGWAIVTSQTCDVAGAPPGDRAPTVQVCPIRPADPTNTSWLREVELRLHTNFFLVDNHPDGRPWVADLRMSLPLSKAALLGATRVHGFSSEQRTLGFIDHLSIKQGRPALHDDLTSLMVPSLRTLLSGPSATDWKYGIEQIRLIVLDGTRLAPVKVQLLAVLEDKDTVRKPLDAWRAKAAKTLMKQPAGIKLAPTLWAHLPKLAVSTYRDAVPLRMLELDRGEFR